MSLLLPRPAAQPSHRALVSARGIQTAAAAQCAAPRGPTKGFSLTIHPASRGAAAPSLPIHPNLIHRGSGPSTAVHSDDGWPRGPVRYGYTAGVAERFAAHPVPGGDRRAASSGWTATSSWWPTATEPPTCPTRAAGSFPPPGTGSGWAERGGGARHRGHPAAPLGAEPQACLRGLLRGAGPWRQHGRRRRRRSGGPSAHAQPARTDPGRGVGLRCHAARDHHQGGPRGPRGRRRGEGRCSRPPASTWSPPPPSTATASTNCWAICRPAARWCCWGPPAPENPRSSMPSPASRPRRPGQCGPATARAGTPPRPASSCRCPAAPC